jgi:hypothetical protein
MVSTVYDYHDVRGDQKKAPLQAGVSVLLSGRLGVIWVISEQLF